MFDESTSDLGQIRYIPTKFTQTNPISKIWSVSMSIDRVEGLVYGVKDIRTCIKFLDDWGMENLETGKAGAIFRTLENQVVILKHIDDLSLPKAV